MACSRMRVIRVLILLVSSFLLLAAVGLGCRAIFSSSWLVVDLLELGAEHHHGIWLDCARLKPKGSMAFPIKLPGDSGRRPRLFTPRTSPLHCTYKFDYAAAQIVDELEEDISNSGNMASIEAKYHQFQTHHLITLLAVGVALSLGTVALCVAPCNFCFNKCSYFFTLLVIIGTALTIVGISCSFLSAQSVSNRFVKGLVGTYNQKLGSAFYMGLGSLFFFIFASIASIFLSYMTFLDNKQRSSVHRPSSTDSKLRRRDRLKSGSGSSSTAVVLQQNCSQQTMNDVYRYLTVPGDRQSSFDEEHHSPPPLHRMKERKSVERIDKRSSEQESATDKRDVINPDIIPPSYQQAVFNRQQQELTRPLIQTGNIPVSPDCPECIPAPVQTPRLQPPFVRVKHKPLVTTI